MPMYLYITMYIYTIYIIKLICIYKSNNITHECT